MADATKSTGVTFNTLKIHAQASMFQSTARVTHGREAAASKLERCKKGSSPARSRHSSTAA